MIMNVNGQPGQPSTWFFLETKSSTLIWADYNDLTATLLGMMVSRGDYPQMALIQVSELI